MRTQAVAQNQQRDHTGGYIACSTIDLPTATTVWLKPLLIAWTGLPYSDATSVGTGTSWVWPCPKLPCWPWPQLYTAPSSAAVVQRKTKGKRGESQHPPSARKRHITRHCSGFGRGECEHSRGKLPRSASNIPVTAKLVSHPHATAVTNVAESASTGLGYATASCTGDKPRTGGRRYNPSPGMHHINTGAHPK